jgi:hypothetical protein
MRARVCAGRRLTIAAAYAAPRSARGARGSRPG